MNGPYRILYHHRIRADDGQAVHVREVVGALRQGGHEVAECALVPKTLGSLPASVPAVSGSRPGPGRLQRVRLPRTAVEVLETLYDRRGRSMLRQRSRSLQPHFVYERHALHCRAGLDIAREFGIPLLLEVNSPIAAEMQTLDNLRFPTRARRTEQAVLAGASSVLAVTRVLGDLLIAAGAPPDRVHVIGNGAELERYGDSARVAAAELRDRLRLPAEVFVLGFTGHMRPWHRLDLVVEAMQHRDLEQVVLLLMGDGPALAPLLQLAVQKGLDARVRAVGTVAAELLPTYQFACDAAVIPAINDYASPLKLFDALAAAVPVVAPDQENLREYVRDGETALLFAPGDAASVARAMVRLVQDRALAHRLGAAGHKALVQNRWTWRGNAERIVRVYESLPAGAPR